MGGEMNSRGQPENREEAWKDQDKLSKLYLAREKTIFVLCIRGYITPFSAILFNLLIFTAFY